LKRVPNLCSHGIQRHNLGVDSLTELEVRSLLKEIETVGNLNLASSMPKDVLARMDRIMQQAVQEASNMVARAPGHGTNSRKD
jgi:hypothetical protein